MKKAYIRTFGCQMNVHDSEKMAGLLRSEGYDLTEDQRQADVIIFNTCSIRQKAEQKFLSELGRTREMKRHRPYLKVAVAGCIAQQRGGALFKRAPQVDFVLGPQNIHSLASLLREGAGIAIEENCDPSSMELPALRRERHRAWVSIMHGCDNYCSYCIVPYTRGRETSRASADVLREVEGLAEGECKEVTLLGQNVNSYRSDVDFPGLLKNLNSVKGLERIRFVTSHPRDLSNSLIDSMAGLEKVCEHIHLPLQSGSTSVLAAMNRGYSFEEYRIKVEKLRDRIPDVAITSDFIAGFPGETGDDHRATMAALSDIRYDGVFAFMYSRRPGTAAAGMEGHLDDDTKLGRLKEILELQDDITLQKNLELEGTRQEILVEGPSDGDRNRLTGRTRTNKIVTFEGGDRLIGRIIGISIRRARRHSLEGELPASEEE